MKYLKDSAGRRFIYTESLFNRGGFEEVEVDETSKPKRTRRKSPEPEPKSTSNSVASALEGWEE